MPRIIATVTFLLLLLACGGGAWAGRQALGAPFIAPGAADVQITETSPGERLITYRMPNPADAWLSATARQLNRQGWQLSTERYAWGDTERFTPTYTRMRQFWFVRVRERAELLGDRNAARITVRYAVDLR